MPAIYVMPLHVPPPVLNFAVLPLLKKHRA
jgi:hypothetical protein